MKSKFRIYAIFQVLSFIALLLLMIVAILLTYKQGQTGGDTTLIESIISTLTFEKQEIIGVTSSLFMYITLILWIITWITGGTILSIKNRNMYDSLFLLFIMIPLLSNIFVFMAQISLKTQDYTLAAIDKKAIIKETEKILKAEAK